MAQPIRIDPYNQAPDRSVDMSADENIRLESIKCRILEEDISGPLIIPIYGRSPSGHRGGLEVTKARLPSGHFDPSRAEGHITTRTPTVSGRKFSSLLRPRCQFWSKLSTKLGAGIAVGTRFCEKVEGRFLQPPIRTSKGPKWAQIIRTRTSGFWEILIYHL